MKTKVYKSILITLITVFIVSVSVLIFSACSFRGEKGDPGKDGVSILSVERKDSEGLKDIYEIKYSDGSTSTFFVTNGANGEDGKDGSQVSIGENGNWFIDGEDTGILARGSDGEDGSNGEDGQTPFIGENGNWWIGSIDTDVPASGQDGAEGKSAYEIAIENGFVGTEEEWLESLKGKDGISIITEVEINGDGELIIHLDGESLNLGKIVGENGQNGEDGVGIEGATIDENGSLILSLSNDTDINVGKVKGEDGKDGENGTDGKDGIGITGVKIENSELIITFSDGNSSNLGNIVGADGKDGTDGVGIDRIELDENYNLTIYLTEGEPIKLGCIRGEKGENGADGKDGKSAYELYKEKFGYEGTEEQWLIDLANGNLADVKTYTVTFDAQGGSPIPEAQKVKHLGKIKPTQNPKKEGYIFDGWYYGEEKWSFVGYVVTENIMLTAKWIDINSNDDPFPEISSAKDFVSGTEIINETQIDTITRKVNNRTESFDLSQNITVAKEYTWKLFSDYERTKEIENKIMSNLVLGNSSAYLVVYDENDLDIFKVYKVYIYRRHIYQYSFMNEETVFKTGEIEEDSNLSEPSGKPEKTGYEFSHWTLNDEKVEFPIEITSDKVNEERKITFEVEFTPNENTLHFDGNGKTDGTMADMKIHSDETIELNVNEFVRDGYTFKGWATSTDGEVEYTDGETYTMGTKSEYTLYAVWEANSLTLSFDGNGADEGTSQPSIPTHSDAEVTIPDKTEFSRKGYTFVGWSTEEDNEAEHSAEKGWTYKMGTSDVTLYAVWKPIDYTITIGTKSISVNVENIDGKASEIQSIMDKESLIVGEKQFLGWGLPGSKDLNSVAPEENHINSTKSVIQYLKDNPTNFELVAVYGVSEFKYGDPGKTLISKYLGETGEDIVVYIPDNITTINPFIFDDEITDNEITVILDSIIFGKCSQTKDIKDDAFTIRGNSSRLEVNSITFPKTLEAFEGSYNIYCKSLTDIDIGTENDNSFVSNNMFVLNGTLVMAIDSEVSIVDERISAIGGEALENTVNKVFIKSGLKSIHPRFNSPAFSVTEIYFAGTEDEWNKLSDGGFILNQDYHIEYNWQPLPEA